VIYVSIGNLFANRTIPEDSSSDEEGDKEDNIDEDNNKDSNDNRDENSDKDSNESSSDSDNEGEKSKGCQVMKSQKPIGCQSHNVRECDSEDANCGADEFSCDFNLL